MSVKESPERERERERKRERERERENKKKKNTAGHNYLFGTSFLNGTQSFEIVGVSIEIPSILSLRCEKRSISKKFIDIPSFLIEIQGF